MDKITIIVLIICVALSIFVASVLVGYATGNAIQDNKCHEYMIRFEDCRSKYNNDCLYYKPGGMFEYENFSINLSMVK